MAAEPAVERGPGDTHPLGDVRRRGLGHAEAQVAGRGRVQHRIQVDAGMTLLGHGTPCIGRRRLSPAPGLAGQPLNEEG